MGTEAAWAASVWRGEGVLGASFLFITRELGREAAGTGHRLVPEMVGAAAPERERDG